eukprot:14816365-Alexandrium_andersonii.AAC.1
MGTLRIGAGEEVELRVGEVDDGVQAHGVLATDGVREAEELAPAKDEREAEALAPADGVHVDGVLAKD